MTKPKAIRTIAVIAAVGVVAATAACTADPGASKDNESDPFVFAGAGDASSLDPSLATDGETFRITRQVFDTLLDHEPGGDEIVPGLAKDYEPSEDGTEWNFTLNEGVKFHDGEDLTAQVVCDNFDRWYNWEGNYQNPALSTYWQDTFGGFANNEDDNVPDANYDGCETNGDLELTISVKEATAKLPGGFSLSAFSIHSPKSLEAYGDQEPEGDDPEAMNYPDYSQEVGDVAGTGPYKYTDWDHGQNEIKVEANEDYWGEQEPQIKNMVFRTIPKENDRKQALVSGDIDGYDLVAPQDVSDLEEADMEVPSREPFNILYLGMTQSQDGEDNELADKDVRQAIAHSMNKEQIINQVFPDGAEEATQFQPPTLDGHSDEVETYDFDPEAAKQLLDDAGQEDLTLDFCYPTDVTRPYMPAPESIYENMKANLEDVGITVEDKPLTWAPDYTDGTENGACDLYILGWTADYAEAYNFMGTWFANEEAAWGFDNSDIRDALAEADAEPDQEARGPLYQKANEEIMDFIPGVPISHSSPSIAFAPYVDPPQTSPLTQELFNEISFK